ncbi:MAG: SPFH domain-containing protein [Phycisphaeraceae bacterium]
MSQDQQTYTRAAHAALVGLAAQLGLAIFMAVLGLYAESTALHAAGLHLFGGLPLWLMLWVIYNQHRLERAEALEAEQLARADARTAALFEEAGQQLQLARKRLDNLYRFGLPTVSALMAAYLLLVGGAWLVRNYRALTAGELGPAVLSPEASAGVVALLAGVVGFLAFLVARYVAGMTRVPAWVLLRGGSAYLMGNAAVAVLIALGAVVALLGNIVVLGWMALIVPAVMVVLGVEILIEFLLAMYRPRRAGEAVRPAFDSRVLGWLTRPESLGKIVGETINYQFGFEVSRSWFYRLLARAIAPLIIFAAVVLLAASTLVIVAPHEQAIITTFGGSPRVVEPGVWGKWPWPIGRAERFDAYRVREMILGSKEELIDPDVAILWTNEHAGEETFLLTAPTQVRGVDLGPDTPVGELVGGQISIRWRIKNLETYAQLAGDPERLLRHLAERQISRYFSTRTVDELLTVDRRTMGETMRERIQADVDAVRRGSLTGLGIEIVHVGALGVHPPQAQDVAASFHELIGVFQENEVAVQQAQRDAIGQLAEIAGSHQQALAVNDAIRALRTMQRQRDEVGEDEALEAQIHEQQLAIEALMNDAGGRAAQLIHEARADRWQVALREQARASRILAQRAAYEQAPEYYVTRRYFQTLADGLAQRRKLIILADQQAPASIRLQLEDSDNPLGQILGQE